MINEIKIHYFEKENCEQYNDETFQCKGCSNSFLLYKGECVLDCPSNSKKVDSSCIDLDEETISNS